MYSLRPAYLVTAFTLRLKKPLLLYNFELTLATHIQVTQLFNICFLRKKPLIWFVCRRGLSGIPALHMHSAIVVILLSTYLHYLTLLPIYYLSYFLLVFSIGVGLHIIILCRPMKNPEKIYRPVLLHVFSMIPFTRRLTMIGCWIMQIRRMIQTQGWRSGCYDQCQRFVDSRWLLCNAREFSNSSNSTRRGRLHQPFLHLSQTNLRFVDII